jgi:hypothetical protein
MSELQLSGELIDEVMTTLVKHDPQAQDPSIGLQYLAAIIGLVLGNQQASSEDKQAFMEQLNAFSNHVLSDVEEQLKQHQQQQAAPAEQESVGIWKPDGV